LARKRRGMVAGGRYRGGGPADAVRQGRAAGGGWVGFPGRTVLLPVMLNWFQHPSRRLAPPCGGRLSVRSASGADSSMQVEKWTRRRDQGAGVAAKFGGAPRA